MKPKIFVINLVGDNVVYFAGSTIQGNVVLELTRPKKAQEISIVLSGLAYVKWTKDRISCERREVVQTDEYTDSEIIINDLSLRLWGDGRDSQEIAAGRYEFPFKFQVPSDQVLPTSFEGPFGYIRYTLLSKIKRLWRFNYTSKRAITVNDVIDVNTPQLTQSLSSSNEKTTCCLCCASGPISLSVTTDRGAYCPGESIAISTEVENHSYRRMNAIRATLKQVVVFYAQGRSRYSGKIIQRISGPAGASSNWSNELLPIPATVPSISNCRIINVWYVLTVTIAIPLAVDLHVTIPLTIGNVPFRGGQSSMGTSASPPGASSLLPTGSSPPPEGDPYPPPTANPYVTVGPAGGAFNYSATCPPVNIGDDDYTMGDTQYVPMYGFVTDYHFAPPPSYSEAVVRVQGSEN